MKKERITCLVSCFINIIITLLKIICGMIFKSYALITSGYYTLMNLINDAIALIMGKFESRRANNRYPFGYGKEEFIFQIVLGFIMLLFSGFIIYKTFIHSYVTPNINIIYFIILIILLIVLNANYLFNVGKNIRSEFLIANCKITYKDLLSTGLTFLIVLASTFFPIMDMVGCLYIAFLIIQEGLSTIINGLYIMNAETINDDKIRKDVAKIVNDNKMVEFSDIEILRIKSYYQIIIEISLSSNSIADLIKIEQNIKRNIKKRNRKIIFIDFNVISA